MREEIIKLRKLIDETFNDMTVLYAPEFVGEESIKQTRDRIAKYGAGTIHYIDKRHKEAKKILRDIYILRRGEG